MAKKQDKNTQEEFVVDPVAEENYDNLLADDTGVPQDGYEFVIPDGLPQVEFTDWLEVNDPQGIKVKAKELVGQFFTIIKANIFTSMVEGRPTEAFYVVGILTATGELFHTVLGGKVVMGELKAFFGKPLYENPVFMLRHVDRGPGSSYYTLGRDTSEQPIDQT